MFLITRSSSIASTVILSSSKSLWLPLPSLSLQGPEVGVSNNEVRFRDFEIARIQSPQRVNRIHWAPGDCAKGGRENILVDGMGAFQAL